MSKTLNANVIVKDYEKAKEKKEKKKAKKALKAAKKKKEQVNAATKQEEKAGEKHKDAVVQYCFRCGSESHQVRTCDKTGDLKCIHHPNHVSHLTDACSTTRLQKGLPLHPFMASKRNGSHTGATVEVNSSFEGNIDDSITIFSDGDSPSTEQTCCSVTVEYLGKREEETDSEATDSEAT